MAPQDYEPSQGKNMSESTTTPNCLTLTDAIAAKIRMLPRKKFHLEATTPLGSYVDSSLKMVKLDEVIQSAKKLLLAPEIQGLTRLPEYLWQQVERELRSLPSKKIKVDPFHQYNRDSTLFVEDDYVELEDVLAAIGRLSDSLEFLENFIVESLCQLIQWKEARVSAESASSEDAAPSVAVPLDEEQLLELEGTREETERAEQIRTRTIAELRQSEAIGSFSSKISNYLQAAIRQTTAASWWLKNEPRTARGLLLQASSLIDRALAEERF